MTLRYVALLLSGADYSSERAINESQVLLSGQNLSDLPGI